MIRKLLLLFTLLAAALTMRAQPNSKLHNYAVGIRIAPNDTDVVYTYAHGDAHAQPFLIKGKNPFDYKSNRVGVINWAAKIIVAPKYINCSPFFGGYALVEDTGNNYGLIDTLGRQIIKPARQRIALCRNGLIIIGRGNFISFVNRAGKVIVPLGKYRLYATPPAPTNYMESTDDVGHSDFRWTPLSFFGKIGFDNYIGVKGDGKWAVINKAGREIIAPKYDWIGIFNKQAAPVRMDKKYGVTDAAGKLLVPAVYDNVTLSKDNFVLVTQNKRMGVLGLNCKMFIPINYKWISQIGPNAFLANEDGEHLGVVSAKNEVIVPFKHRRITPLGPGFVAELNYDSTALFSATGKMLTQYIRGGRIEPPVWDMGGGDGVMVYDKRSRQYVHYDNIREKFAYFKNNKWGLLDTANSAISQPIYDELEDGKFNSYYTNTYSTAIAARIGDKWGILSRSGKILYDFKYQRFGNEGTSATLIMEGKKMGLLDSKLKLVAPIKYDQIYMISPGYNSPQINYHIFPVRVGTKWGFVNYKGKVLSPLKYDGSVVIEDDVTVVTAGKKAGLMDTSGVEVLPCIYDEIQPGWRGKLFIVKQNGLFGLANHAGKFIAPIAYDQIAIVDQSFDHLHYYYQLFQNKKTGIMDGNGKMVIPMIYDELELYRSKYIVAKKGGLAGVIDHAGKVLVPFKYGQLYEFQRYFRDKVLFSMIDNGKTGLVTEEGKVLLPAMYDAVSFVNNKHIGVKQNNKYGLVNWDNQIVVPCIYDDLWNYPANYVLRIGTKQGLMDLNGKVLIPVELNYISEYTPNNYIISSVNKIGIVDHKGVELVKPIYDSVDFCRPDYLIVKKGDKVGLFDCEAKMVYPCIYKAVICEDGSITPVPF